MRSRVYEGRVEDMPLRNIFEKALPRASEAACSIKNTYLYATVGPTVLSWKAFKRDVFTLWVSTARATQRSTYHE